MKTFRELYCERHKIDPARYDELVFRRTLYPHARATRWVISFFKEEYFRADREFVAGVGRLSARSGFRTELSAYYYHPGNRGFLRRILRFRVSAERLRLLFEAEIS